MKGIDEKVMSTNNNIQRRLWLGMGMWLYVIGVVVWFFLDDSISNFELFMKSVLAFIFAIFGTNHLYEWRKQRQKN